MLRIQVTWLQMEVVVPSCGKDMYFRLLDLDVRKGCNISQCPAGQLCNGLIACGRLVLPVILVFLNLIVVLNIAELVAPERSPVWLAQLHASAVQQGTMPQLLGLTALRSAGLALQDGSLLRGPLFALCAQLVPFPTNMPLLNAQGVLQENIRLKLELIPLQFACHV